MKIKTILIAAGGTGGHIFPAIVFGKRLEKNERKVFWLCGSRKLEKEIYNSSGIEPFALSLAGSPLGTRSIFKILKRIFDVFKSFNETLFFIKENKPEIVFLFGGYISFAPLIISLIKGIPVILHEQNAVSGRVTRLASKFGVLIITGWPKCYGIKNYIAVGIPVREPERIEKKLALKKLGLENLNSENKKIVGVAGGSLGSGPLSEILKKTALICKEFDFVFLSSKEKKDEGNLHFIKSQWDMNPFYSICDILVCRSGGSTLAEALKWKIKTITIPWPGAADNHQEKNAEEFVKMSNLGRIFSENGKPEDLAEVICNLKKS